MVEKKFDAAALEKKYRSQFSAGNYEGCLKTMHTLIESTADKDRRGVYAADVYSYASSLRVTGNKEPAMMFLDEGAATKNIAPSLRARFFRTRSEMKFKDGDEEGYKKDAVMAEALEKQSGWLQAMVDRMLFR